MTLAEMEKALDEIEAQLLHCADLDNMLQLLMTRSIIKDSIIHLLKKERRKAA